MTIYLTIRQIRSRVAITILFILISAQAFSQHSLSGKVTDNHTGELLTGASITINSVALDRQKSTSAGLDGSFHFSGLPKAEYSLEVHFAGYNKTTVSINIESDTQQSLRLAPILEKIQEVQVTGRSTGTDIEARRLERVSSNVLNIISAKQIELSPDITVANVVQRVSGLSIERNANGDPQYAVIRGMNKRYNNTLVNGIKIPSPDNDNRFVPLDIFPAVFLDRLAVYKSLTADMEADAIGGTIDMQMKSAPSTGKILEFDIQAGQNLMNMDGSFVRYDRSEVYKKSPAELYGSDYYATAKDFSALQFTPIKNNLPDLLASVSYGRRFLNNKLGILTGASYQNSYRPNQNYFYDPTVLNSEGNPLRMNELIERRTSTQQERVAFHAKADYNLSPNHTFSIYAGQFLLNEFRVREQFRQESFVATTGYAVYPATRITNTYQTISIANLSAKHTLADHIKLDWSAVYSRAKNELPDDAIFMRSAEYDAPNKKFITERLYSQDSPNARTWERNQDNDLAFYINNTYSIHKIPVLSEVKIGGMYRQKNRDNFYNYYKYNVPLTEPGIRWKDWSYFKDILWDNDMTSGYASGNNSNLVYDADETILGYFVNSIWNYKNLHINAGLRAEHTTQNYLIDRSSESRNKENIEGEQNYFNLFPTISLKYSIKENQFLKTTYFKGISRPGFYEIVPTNRPSGGGDSFYHERGNPDLKPTIGHNIDLRYEIFPNALDQILVGAFYKRLIDPIEYGFPQVKNGNEKPSTGSISPQNFGTGTNYGIELDYTKYFRRFGVRLNYTYTKSNISTNKIYYKQEGAENPPRITEETRPLQGQSDHVGNISLLYKDQDRKWDIQLVLNYTGERLAVVSPYLGADQYMRPMSVLDLSIEKGIKRFVVFAKANNLLNTPYQLIVNKPLGFSEYPFSHQENPTSYGNIRRDSYGESFRLGLRFRM